MMVHMRTRNRGYYEEDGLTSQNWKWPEGTWFQERLNYVRQQQRSRILKSHLKSNFLPSTGDVSFDGAKEPKMGEISSFRIHGEHDIAKAIIAHGSALPLNQRHAPASESKPKELRINNTSPRMRVERGKEQYLIRLNRCRYLFGRIGKTAAMALGLLIISLMPYLLVHFQKPNDIAVSKKAVPLAVPDSVPTFDKLTFPQPAEVNTTGLQAKPIPSLNVDSSTDVPEQTGKPTELVAEPETSEMAVAAKTNPAETKAASRKASDYKTIRITPLRQEPRFAAAITEDIDSGTVVTVFEVQGDWLKIKIGGVDSVGYVRKEYVVPVS